MKVYSLKQCLKCKKEFQPTSGNQKHCGSDRKKIGCSYNKSKERHKIADKTRLRIIDTEQRKRWSCNYYRKHRNEVIFRTYQQRLKRALVEGYFSKKEWEELKKKYNYTCSSCGMIEPKIKLTKDHIIPLNKNGTNWIDNIQPLCGSCNSKKGIRIIRI